MNVSQDSVKFAILHHIAVVTPKNRKRYAEIYRHLLLPKICLRSLPAINECYRMWELIRAPDADLSPHQSEYRQGSSLSSKTTFSEGSERGCRKGDFSGSIRPRVRIKTGASHSSDARLYRGLSGDWYFVGWRSGLLRTEPATRKRMCGLLNEVVESSGQGT
jgi:hypothetical protein